MAELENGWYISSTDDPNLEYVIDNGNGKYTFKPKAGGKTYEITYVEDGKTGTTIYTPNTEECNPCYKETTFNGWAGPNSFSPFPSAGGTAKVVYNLGECWEVKVVRNTNNATAVTTSQTSSSISVAKNETTAAIISEVEYEFKNKYVPTATKNETVKIYQQSKCSTDTECPEVSPAEKHIGKEESDVEVTFTEGCWILTDKYLTMDGQPVSDDVAKFTTNKIIHVYENKESNSRTIVAEYIFTNNALGRVCNRFVEITQEEGCNCSNVTYEVVKSSFTHEGGSAKIGNLTTCDRNKTRIEVKDGDEYISSGPTIGTPTNDVYPVSITVKSNETRDTTHVKYVINFNGQQCKPGESETPPYYDLIIKPRECKCRDIDVIFEGDGAHKFDLNQQDNVILCKLQVNSNCVDVSDDMFDYSTSHFTQIRIGNKIRTNPDIYNVMADLPGLNTAESTSFSIKVGNYTCGPFMIYRTCFCGTDNCKVEFPDGSIETYPLHVDSTSGANAHTSFGDKVYIPVDVLMDRDGNSVPATGTGVPDAYEVYTTDNYGQTWCKVYYYAQNNIGYLHYICEDNTGPQRKATFTFKVPDNTILRSDVGAPERWVGKTCCSPFTVELMQASVGHRFAKDGVCRKSGFSNYIEVDLDDPRENHSNLVDCSE